MVIFIAEAGSDSHIEKNIRRLRTELAASLEFNCKFLLFNLKAAAKDGRSFIRENEYAMSEEK